MVACRNVYNTQLDAPHNWRVLVLKEKYVGPIPGGTECGQGAEKWLDNWLL